MKEYLDQLVYKSYKARSYMHMYTPSKKLPITSGNLNNLEAKMISKDRARVMAENELNSGMDFGSDERAEVAIFSRHEGNIGVKMRSKDRVRFLTKMALLRGITDAESQELKSFLEYIANVDENRIRSFSGTKLAKVLGCWAQRVTNTKEAETDKWEFKAPDSSLIDFDKIAEDLDGEHPIIFVDHGKTNKYVVICSKLITKAMAVLCCAPGVETAFLSATKSPNKKYVLYEVSTNFGDWVDWAKRVKASSWPTSNRKDNVVRVSRPQI